MRTILSALIMTLATQANAFDLNLSEIEVRRLKAEYLVDDLAVGVKAVVNYWAFCSKEEQLYINRAAMIDEPSDYMAMFEVVLLPTGGVSVETVPATNRDASSLPFPDTKPCDQKSIRELGFYPVTTIDGVDNFAEYISVALGKGFTIGNKAAAKELRPVVEQTDTYADIFTGLYEDKIKSAISHCLATSTVSSYGIPEEATMHVAASFHSDGRVQPSSIFLVNHSINSDTRAKVLFQGIRRAFLRCQGAGFALPEENYDSWKSMIITFSKSDLFQN